MWLNAVFLSIIYTRFIKIRLFELIAKPYGTIENMRRL